MAKAIRCFVCKHHKRREIDAALKAGVSQAEVVRKLCPEIARFSVGRHFRLDHHLETLGAAWKPATVPIGTKQTIGAKPTKHSKGTKGGVVKVHWELPRDLVKKLKHQAVDAELPVIGLVREILERAL